MNSLLAASCLIVFMTSRTEGRCVSVGLCDDKMIHCRCGQALTVSVSLNRCSCWYRWKHSCKWCDDIGSEEQFCAQFSQCLECHASKTGACSLCPPGKYGRTCNWDCRCANGGVCSQRDGSCSCPSNFYGPHCQHARVPLTETLPSSTSTTSPTPPPHTPSTTTPVTTTTYMSSQQSTTVTSPPEITCNSPPVLSNGAVVQLDDNTGEFKVGQSVEYSCETGYYLHGIRRQTCRQDGSWSGDQPVCHQVRYCEEPDLPSNIRSHLILPTLNQQGRLQRSRSGRSRVVRTQLRTPRRVPRISAGRTPSPALPDTIASEIEGGKFPQQTFLEFRCESQFYELHGSRRRLCRDDGEWSGQAPSCNTVCGKSPGSPRTPSVLNGRPTVAGQWPWVAAVQRRYGEDWLLDCGGTVIAERWVLTAAHCVTEANSTALLATASVRVKLGKYHREDWRDDDSVQTLELEEIIIHESFDPGSLDYDISLLRLSRPANVTSRVQPACLPQSEISHRITEPGNLGTVLGWGVTEARNDSAVLRSAEVPVVSSTTCELDYQIQGFNLPVTANMMCAGFSRGEVDACSGDSGGPLLFSHGQGVTARWYVEGVVSWGGFDGCGKPKQYGGYTKVARFTDWLRDIMF